MSTWNRFWYGTANPLPTKKAAVGILAVLFVSCWFGLRIEFMLSHHWLQLGTIAAVAAGLLFTPWFSRVVADSTGADLKERAVRIPFYVCSFVASSIVFWILVVFAFPGLTTKFLSDEAYATAELNKKRGSRRECEYQVHGEYVRLQPVGYFCITGAEFERLPPNGRMLVKERRSFFGIYVQGVEPADANQPLQPIAREDARSG